MVLMSFGGPNNSVVRDFVGGVRAASYWIGNRLLSASDIVNDSSVTGLTVKAALNTLSSTSSAVFPFTAAGLAEKDLVSYDAGAATWKNRTVAAALSGQVTSTMVSNSSTVPGGSVTTALQEMQPNSVTWRDEFRLSRPLVVKAGQTVTASAGNFILFRDSTVHNNSASVTTGAVICTPSTVVTRDSIFTRCIPITPTTLVSVVGTADASVTPLSATQYRITRLTTTSSALLATITVSAPSFTVFDLQSNMSTPHNVNLSSTGVHLTNVSPTNERYFGYMSRGTVTATPTLNSVSGTPTIGDYFDLTYVGSGTPLTTAANYDSTTFTVS